MIIPSLLDTDLYKFTMMQVVLHHFPARRSSTVRCRNPDADLTPYLAEIRDEIRALCKLRFAPEELRYLRSWRFFKSDFVDLLGLFQLDERFITVTRLAGSEREIDITIRGPWLHTILFEVPVLAIVSEVYNQNAHAGADLTEGAGAWRESRSHQCGRGSGIPCRGLRRATAILARVARRGRPDAEKRHRPEVRRDEQREIRAGNGIDAAGHDGARVPAGVPGGGTTTDRLAGFRFQHLGARVPRRPRHRAV
jgi:nicotinic acid phosphoribosyltransferase